MYSPPKKVVDCFKPENMNNPFCNMMNTDDEEEGGEEMAAADDDEEEGGEEMAAADDDEEEGGEEMAAADDEEEGGEEMAAADDDEEEGGEEMAAASDDGDEEEEGGDEMSEEKDEDKESRFLFSKQIYEEYEPRKSATKQPIILQTTPHYSFSNFYSLHRHLPFRFPPQYPPQLPNYHHQFQRPLYYSDFPKPTNKPYESMAPPPMRHIVNHGGNHLYQPKGHHPSESSFGSSSHHFKAAFQPYTTPKPQIDPPSVYIIDDINHQDHHGHYYEDGRQRPLVKYSAIHQLAKLPADDDISPTYKIPGPPYSLSGHLHTKKLKKKSPRKGRFLTAIVKKLLG